MWAWLRGLLYGNDTQTQAATQPPTAPGFIDLPPSGDFTVEVAGEMHYQPALAAVHERDGAVIQVILACEPDNRYDPNAIAVKSTDGQKLGYIPRLDAPRFAQTIRPLEAQNMIPTCKARIFGGTADKPHRGLWLNIAPATALAAHFGIKYRRTTTPRR